jgi:hypothetical protein
MRSMPLVVGGVLILLSVGAWADTRDDALAGIDRCGAISDNRVWLNCVYGAVQPMRSELGLPPAPASQTSLVPHVSVLSPAPVVGSKGSAASNNHGSGSVLSYLFGDDQTVISKMPLAAYSFDTNGLFTATLANGQIWAQEENGELARWRDPAPQYLVSISRGALGTVDLIVEDENRIYQVRRIR